MTDRRPPRTPLLLSPKALFRYQIVSAVKTRALLGQRMDAAVRAVAAQIHLTPAGESTTVSVRSIYRWLADESRDDPSVGSAWPCSSSTTPPGSGSASWSAPPRPLP